MTSTIPLTYANVQYHTRAPRRKVHTCLDELVREGVLEVDSSDEGELVFSVSGATRATEGPRTFAELERLQALRASVASEVEGKRAERARQQALARERAAADAAAAAEAAESRPDRPGLVDQALELQALKRRGVPGVAQALARGARRDLAQGTDKGRKSLVLSGGLSLLLGPAGWLYAGSFREAIPAAIAYLLILSLIPTFLLLPILGVALPLSSVAGVIYAWQHNQDGKRAPILGSDED